MPASCRLRLGAAPPSRKRHVSSTRAVRGFASTSTLAGSETPARKDEFAGVLPRAVFAARGIERHGAQAELRRPGTAGIEKGAPQPVAQIAAGRAADCATRAGPTSRPGPQPDRRCRTPFGRPPALDMRSCGRARSRGKPTTAADPVRNTTPCARSSRPREPSPTATDRERAAARRMSARYRGPHPPRRAGA